MATLGDDGAPLPRAPRGASASACDGVRTRRRRVHGAGVHHHRPRRQPDHGVPSGRDERLAPKPRRRRRRTSGSASSRPTASEGMREHVAQFAQAGIPFIFDPGQGMPLFDGAELARDDRPGDATSPSTTTKRRMLAERTGLSLAAIAERVEALIVTLGARRLGDPRRRRDATRSRRCKPTALRRSHRLRRRLSRGLAVRHRARLGLGAHRRLASRAGRAQDRIARRAEPRASTASASARCTSDVRSDRLVS